MLPSESHKIEHARGRYKTRSGYLAYIVSSGHPLDLTLKVKIVYSP